MAKIIIKSIPPARKIKAIKVYRDLTGVGLVEGKAVVEMPHPITIDNLDTAAAYRAADEFRNVDCDVEVRDDRSLSSFLQKRRSGEHL